MTLRLCTAEDMGMADTCCNCGGSASLGGTQPPIPGSRQSLRYCSVKCHDEWENRLVERAEAQDRRLACCPECGFDNSEHDDGCSRA